MLVLRRRCERVAALCLVAVLGCEADIDMLARQVSLPSGDCEKKTFDGDVSNMT